MYDNMSNIACFNTKSSDCSCKESPDWAATTNRGLLKDGNLYLLILKVRCLMVYAPNFQPTPSFILFKHPFLEKTKIFQLDTIGYGNYQQKIYLKFFFAFRKLIPCL